MNWCMLLSCHSFETIPGIWRCLWTPSIKNPIWNDHMKMRCDNYYQKKHLNQIVYILLTTTTNVKKKPLPFGSEITCALHSNIGVIVHLLASPEMTSQTSFAVLARQIATFVKGMVFKGHGIRWSSALGRFLHNVIHRNWFSLFFDVKLRFFTNLTHIKMMRWQGLNEIGAHQVVVNTSFHARSSLTLLPALQRRPCVYVSLWIGFIAISCALYILYTKHTGISRFYIWHRL